MLPLRYCLILTTVSTGTILCSARQDAILPLRSPIKGSDGSTINEVFVPKNTTVIIGIRTLNTDPLIWGPDAAEWKPERWLSPLPESVINARIPGVYSNMYVSSRTSVFIHMRIGYYVLHSG